MTDPKTQPGRVVDRDGQGWFLAGDGNGGFHYRASYDFKRGLEPVATHVELAQARGPLRTVLPVTDADRAQIGRLLDDAGRKAVGSLAAAIWQTHQGLCERDADAGIGSRYAAATKLLLAGREGSWESEALMSVAAFGSDLKPSRVDTAARDGLAATVTGWVTDENRYTEVAETLAFLVSSHADQAHGPAGWKRIADQWLQPGGVDAHGFRTCYGLLYSQSAHFDSGLL